MPTTADLDAEIEAERRHLAESRAALARMRERAQQLFDTGATVAADAFAAESLGVALSDRIRSLVDDPNTPLFFGRLTVAEPTAESFHIGRRHVTDDAGEPMVLDWRAPVCQAFYQASATDPQGVAVRRRFGFSGGTLTGFEDEHLARGEELGTASRTTEDEDRQRGRARAVEIHGHVGRPGPPQQPQRRRVQRVGGLVAGIDRQAVRKGGQTVTLNHG